MHVSNRSYTAAAAVYAYGCRWVIGQQQQTMTSAVALLCTVLVGGLALASADTCASSGLSCRVAVPRVW
jgi:uncharacterized membrane protein (DUF4010 family)